MNKLLSQVFQNGTETRRKRAIIVTDSLIAAQANLVNELGNRLRKIQIELDRLVDFGPQQTTDLTVGSGNFQPDNLVRAIHMTKVQETKVAEEYAIARDTLREWQAPADEPTFSESAIPTATFEGEQPPSI